MTDGHVTRCPHCDTSFRVTDAQLEAARGAVRCGACLLVFSATEHLVLPKPDEETVLEDDTLESLDETVDETLDEAVDEAVDEAPALIESLADALPPPEQEGLELESETPELTADVEEPDEGEEADALDGLYDDEFEEDETWPIDRADSDEDAIEELDAELDGEALRDDLEETDAGESDEAEIEDEPALTASEPEFAESLDIVGEGAEPVPEPVPEFDIEDEPPNLDEVAEPWRPAWRWWGAAAALLVLLGVQFLWFERSRLSLVPEYRDAYVSVCRYLPCKLPEYSAPEALGISGLIIRSHPTRAGALRADALLANDARWRQDFPDLRLEFSDLQNTPVAARIFSPDEYLAGEMAGLRFIPGRTEVRVTLEIMDPGPDALNYSLEIL